jgi:cell wall-associated NlpC family hydrolase
MNIGMTETEHLERARVVAIAHTWLRTPYHHHARVKHAGADCITLLAAVYEEAGLLPLVTLPHYSVQWHLHREAELYLNGLLKYAHEIPGDPLPGDIVVWRIGRCYSHGAIVVNWPQIIHAQINRCVMLDQSMRHAG